MIYVIASSAFKGDSLEEHETILKIGYTKDENKVKRFSNYETHNPTYKVLYEIPDGAEEDEKALHEYFKNYKYGKTREWFKYCDEILEFFKIHPTIDLIRKDIAIFLKKEILLKDGKPIYRKPKVMPIVWPYIVSIQEVIGELDYSLVSDYRMGHDNFCEEWIKLYYPEESEKILTHYRDTQSKITLEMKNFIDDLRGTSKPFSDRLKDLCNTKDFTEEEKKIIAQQTPEKFDRLYNILGSGRCKACGYRSTELEREIDVLASKDNISKEFYFRFMVGKRYTNIEAKSMVREIYEDLGLVKNPKAVDLNKYFETKKVQIFIKGNKYNGLELLDIKRS